MWKLIIRVVAGLTLEECQLGQDVGTPTMVGHLYRQVWMVRIHVPAFCRCPDTNLLDETR
jgi:hypothetical protein